MLLRAPVAAVASQPQRSRHSTVRVFAAKHLQRRTRPLTKCERALSKKRDANPGHSQEVALPGADGGPAIADSLAAGEQEAASPPGAATQAPGADVITPGKAPDGSGADAAPADSAGAAAPQRPAGQLAARGTAAKGFGGSGKTAPGRNLAAVHTPKAADKRERAAARAKQRTLDTAESILAGLERSRAERTVVNEQAVDAPSVQVLLHSAARVMEVATKLQRPELLGAQTGLHNALGALVEVLGQPVRQAAAVAKLRAAAMELDAAVAQLSTQQTLAAEQAVQTSAQNADSLKAPEAAADPAPAAHEAEAKAAATAAHHTQLASTPAAPARRAPLRRSTQPALAAAADAAVREVDAAEAAGGDQGQAPKQGQGEGAVLASRPVGRQPAQRSSAGRLRNRHSSGAGWLSGAGAPDGGGDSSQHDFEQQQQIIHMALKNHWCGPALCLRVLRDLDSEMATISASVQLPSSYMMLQSNNLQPYRGPQFGPLA